MAPPLRRPDRWRRRPSRKNAGKASLQDPDRTVRKGVRTPTDKAALHYES